MYQETERTPIIERLWPDEAPGAAGVELKEEVVDRAEDRVDRHVRNVSTPTLSIWLPEKEKAIGASVVICPGGAYWLLAFDKEGHDIARFLNSFGVAGIVLKYRLPSPDGHVFGHEAPLQDAQRALRTVRHRSGDWGLDAERVGILGFSAGGHLAATASTLFDRVDAPIGDAVDKLSARPDFAALIYAVATFQKPHGHGGSKRNLLGENPPEDLVRKYDPVSQVDDKTPPTFLVSTDDDSVPSENSVLYYLALRKAKVSGELHVWRQGGHGYGLLPTGKPVAGWGDNLRLWMEDLGLLKRRSK